MPVATKPKAKAQPLTAGAPLTNADIAHQLRSLAQLLAAQGENPFKIKAYRRAAETIQALPDSIDSLVRQEADLTTYSGIGTGIAGAIREIVVSGNLRKLEKLRAEVSPELAALNEFPRLDPKRVQQIYRKLGISSVTALKEKLESGEIAAKLGPRIEHHVRQALVTSQELLLFDVDEIVPAIEDYLRSRAGVRRVEAAGEYRRRVETIRELTFVVETDDFPAAVAAMDKYGGRSERVSADENRATFRLPIGLLVTLELAPAARWGLAVMVATGAEAHLAALEAAGHDVAALARSRTRFSTERAVYQKLGLQYIPAELREGRDEVERAAKKRLPRLVAVGDIRGDLHMHTTASDGAHTIEQMAATARERGYDYIGIADHSQSLKIAGGLSEDDLWKHIRRIDKVNAKLRGIRWLK